MIYISIQKRDYDCSEFTPESIVSAGEKVLVCRPMYKGKLTDNLISALYCILPESYIQQIVHQAGSSATYISNSQIPCPPAILLCEAMDGRKHKST